MNNEPTSQQRELARDLERILASHMVRGMPPADAIYVVGAAIGYALANNNRNHATVISNVKYVSTLIATTAAVVYKDQQGKNAGAEHA